MKAIKLLRKFKTLLHNKGLISVQTTCLLISFVLELFYTIKVPNIIQLGTIRKFTINAILFDVWLDIDGRSCIQRTLLSVITC
jgi:hypothetical protein